MKCPKCNGRKYIELDKIGLLTAECDECKGAGVVEDVLTQDTLDKALTAPEYPTVPLSVEDLEALSKDSFIAIDKEEDCTRLVNGICELGYQDCALTRWSPNCKNRKTLQPDKEEANDNSTGVEPDNQPIGSADPSESTVTKKSKTSKRTRKRTR